MKLFSLPKCYSKSYLPGWAFLCVCWLLPSLGHGQAQLPDSLKRLYSDLRGEERVIKQFSIYTDLTKQSSELALQFALAIYQEAVENHDSLTIVKSANGIGWAYKEQGYFSKAIEYYDQALTIAQVNGYSDQVKFLLNNLAISHLYNGSYDKALDYNFKSLRLREKEDDKRGVTIAYNNIGLVYYKMADHENALVNFLKAYQLAKENSIIQGIERNQINIGLAYLGLNKHVHALKYFQEVFETCQTDCKPVVLIEAHNGAGMAYFYQGEMEKAELEFLRSNELAQEGAYLVHTVQNYHFLAQIQVIKKSLDKALSYLAKSQEIAEQLHSREYAQRNFELYSEIYSQKGDYQRALEFFRKHTVLKDSLYNDDLAKNLSGVLLQHQQAQTNEVLAVKDEQIFRNKKLNYLLATIVALSFLLAIFLFWIVRIKQRSNKKLSAAKEVIEAQNKNLAHMNLVLETKVNERTQELKKSNEALLKSNADLDQFIYKTSHDIRGPLASLRGVCNLAMIEIQDPKAVDFFEKLNATANKLNEILSRLLVINQINHSSVYNHLIHFDEIIDEILTERAKVPNAHKIQIHHHIDPEIDFLSDPYLIHIILSNLISNAIRYYNDSERVDSFVEIHVKKLDRGVQIRVVDNGIGIDKSSLDKIFEIFGRASEKTDSAGIGLYLARLATEKLQGEIKVGTTTENFTEFQVTLPYLSVLQTAGE
jgi:signal transduction histidine kinase